MPLYRNYVTAAGQIDDMVKRLAAETDAAGRRAADGDLGGREQPRGAGELKTTPPNVTTDRMTRTAAAARFRSGSTAATRRRRGRNCQGSGCGHGDFLTSGLSNMSDAYLDEWVTSLDALKGLDFDTVMPGHGEAFTDKAKIGYFQDYLRDVWTEVGKLKRQGVPAEDAAKRVDMTKHSAHFPIQGPGVPPIAVTRIYELLDRR
jgi:hypothetical protein